MKLKQFLIAVCIGMMFVACSSREEDFSIASTKEIKLTAQISTPSTRATDDATELQNVSFKNGELVNVYITKSSPLWEDVDEYSGSSLCNETKNSGVSTAFPFKVYDGVLSSTFNYRSYRFPETGTINIHAFYPNTVRATSRTFTIETDQSTPEKYRKSDLMVAVSEGVTSSDNPINLTFEHKLCKLVVKLVKGDESITDEELSTATIHFCGCTTCNLNIKGLNVTSSDPFSFTISNFGAGGIINLGTYNPNGNAAIVLPFSTEHILQTEECLYLTMNGVEHSVFASQDFPAFESGKVYTLTVKVYKDAINLSNVSVKDWLPGTELPEEEVHL